MSSKSRTISLIIVSVIFLTMFIIAHNLGVEDKIEVKEKSYENDVYLLDDSVVHEIKIGLNKSDYDTMVKTYQASGEKEYFRASVTIDGVTIPDVGIRLKGNLTLMLTLGGNPSFPGVEGRNDGPPFAMRGDSEMPGRANFPFKLDEEMVERMGYVPMPPWIEVPENWEKMTDEERSTFMAGNGRGGFPGMRQQGGNPPFLIKFNEFIPDQTYQNFEEIAVRLGSDKSLLGEPISFYIHRKAGQIIPEIAYAVVKCAENEPSLYVICENIDKKYTEKYFPDSDGILYKAGNFAGFDYKGEAPTLYEDVIKQKTDKQNDNLKPVIEFMKFVTESSDEEFESELPNRLDIGPFIRMMAIDNLIDNSDSFVGMGSNYFLYYDKGTKKFTMLSWDMNLSMAGGPGMMRRGIGNNGAPQLEFGHGNGNKTESEDQRRAIFEEWLKGGGLGEEDNSKDLPEVRRGPGNVNILKERFFKNETFSKMYDKEYNNLKAFIFTQISALDKVDAMARVLTSYNEKHNIIEQSEYDSGVERIKSYIREKQKEFGLN